jgi:uncharacterized protein YbdZ (MbtH family)
VSSAAIPGWTSSNETGSRRYGFQFVQTHYRGSFLLLL